MRDMPTCKDCCFFVQGDRKSGTCKKRPFVSTRQGGIATIDGKPRILIVSWSHTACKMFEKDGEDDA